tara:strand:+ start:919 stop:2130 length:1212 start_codon:yes stop_codon:yes gene_type:complete
MNRRLFINSLASSAFGLTALKGAAKNPNPKVKNVIYICLDGGMSHIDSFDPKDDAEVKGATEKIGANVAGIQIGHRLPKLAQTMDKICIIRSMHSKTGAHGPAQYLNRTSYRQIGTIVHPSLGSWVSHLKDRDREIPDYVLISGSSAHPKAGFLPRIKSPLPIVDPNAGLRNVRADRHLNERLGLLQSLNAGIVSKKYPIVKEYSDFYDDTIKFLKSKDLELFDLSKEDPKKRDAYGKTKLGQGCLLAKRLITGDIQFIEINNGGWDTHVDNFTKLDSKLKELDDALSALILDLESEGLLDNTLISLTTDFGRTPRINVNSGRDHHPKCYSALMIGAGVNGGTVIGESDKKAINVTSKPYTVADLNRTVAHLVGIDVEEEHFSPTGRPFTVAQKGQVMKEILN